MKSSLRQEDAKFCCIMYILCYSAHWYIMPDAKDVCKNFEKMHQPIFYSSDRDESDVVAQIGA